MIDWIIKCNKVYDIHFEKSKENKAWRVKDTAIILGRSLSATALDIRMAMALRENPEVRHMSRQECVGYVNRVKHRCTTCSVPNEEHTTKDECIHALQNELGRVTEVLGRVRRLSKDVVGELEDV